MDYVSCKLMGGLGNQLFQIFAVIAYSMKNNCNFVFEYTKELKVGITRNTFWDNFLTELISYTTKNSNNSLISPYLNRFPVYREDGFHYTMIPSFTNTQYISFFGYFQSYKYFEDQWDKIKQLINLPSKREKVIHQYNSLFKDYYNVSMHFRMGDYKEKQQYHPIMELEYYDKSLQYIVSMINVIKNNPNIQVIYFCEKEDNDEVQIIIEQLSQKYSNITFTKVNDGIPDWQQMLLMSCCQSNIIANSSFSWWGAYMNDNKNKFVCYPDKWFGPAAGNRNMNDLFPEKWNKIKL